MVALAASLLGAVVFGGVGCAGDEPGTADPRDADLAPQTPPGPTPEEITPEVLLARARLAGAYLARSVQPNGSFVYEYDAHWDKVSWRYNILRHAGTVYAMAQLHRSAPDPNLIDAAGRALDYLLAQVHDLKIDGNAAAVVVENKRVKLGGNALAVLAIVEHALATGDRSNLPVARALARWMLSVQAPDGRFYVHKMTWPERTAYDWRSGYYPGEAAYALVRLGEIDPNGPWEPASRAAARYLVNAHGEDPPADHWLMYALRHLLGIERDPPLQRGARRIARGILDTQRTGATDDRPEWIGSFYTPPRTTPSATRAEALASAWFIARRAGLDDWGGDLADGLERSVRFVMQAQYLPGVAADVLRHGRVAGAFRGSLSDHSIRIDYVQHAISAMVLYREVLLAGR